MHCGLPQPDPHAEPSMATVLIFAAAPLDGDPRQMAQAGAKLQACKLSGKLSRPSTEH